MDTYVFLGSLLAPEQAHRHLRATYLPAATNALVMRVLKSGARVVGIVDVASQRERERLHDTLAAALDRNVRVYGAAALGARSAYDLRAQGAIGVGTVYDWYCEGTLPSDEFVRVAQPDPNPRNSVESFVNVRATIDRGMRTRAIGVDEGQQLIAAAALLLPEEQAFTRVVERAKGLTLPRRHELARWLAAERVDIQHHDTLDLLRLISAREAQESERTPA